MPSSGEAKQRVKDLTKGLGLFLCEDTLEFTTDAGSKTRALRWQMGA